MLLSETHKLECLINSEVVKILSYSFFEALQAFVESGNTCA
jgi:hypothetical protein